MKIEYDPAKSARNARERGLAFDRAADFDFEHALIFRDMRRDYGEERRIAIGYLDNRLHVLCHVRLPRAIREISLRKANTKEAKKYDRPKTLNG